MTNHTLQLETLPLPNQKAVLGFIGVLALVLTVNLGLYFQTAQAQVGPNSTEALLIDLTNEQRLAAHEKPLRYSAALTSAATAKAHDMLKNGYFEHISPAGRTPWNFIKEADYDYLKAGENLAIDFDSVKQVVPAWMASPAHKANILKADYQEVGIAAVKGNFKGHETTVVVQMFGTKPFSLLGL